LEQDFNTLAVQLRYVPLWQHFQEGVPINRIIKEILANIRLPHHPTAYIEVWKFIFQFLKTIWIIPEAEHIAL
jgi:hypothetical protein